MIGDELWRPAVRLLRRATGAMILLGAWQVAVDLVLSA